MHKINYSNFAYNDVEEILSYISNKLKNPTAAVKLKKKIVKSESIISLLPYVGSSYINDDGKQYYKYRVDNYYIIYSIDDFNKTINILRVLYIKRIYQKLLNNIEENSYSENN